jgi:glucose/mannose transport system substrate-binding protein
VKVLLLLTVLLAGAGATRAAEPTRKVSERLSFYHWWTSPSEAVALDGLVGAFQGRYPDVTVQPMVAGRGTAAVLPVLEARARAGNPPEAVFAHGGYSPEPLVRAGLLSPVDEVWASEKLEAVIPPVIQEMSKNGGRYYVVPLGIHRDNVIWYNKALLATHGIDPATLTTWEAFFAAARKLRAAGVDSPVQMGEAWTAAHAFACIVASQGLAVYEDWANGKIRKGGDPRLAEALNVFKQYAGYANRDHAQLGWDAAIERIIKGDGAFSIMGDWADGVFRQAGLAFGTDYGALLVPGTAGAYGVTLDAFARPPRPTSTTSSDRWLGFVASREGQDAFNSRKGSIPARTDTDAARYTAYQQSAIDDFRTAKRMFPGLGTAMPDDYQAELQKILAAFLGDLDVNKADEAMAQATIRAGASYTRTWSLD